MKTENEVLNLILRYGERTIFLKDNSVGDAVNIATKKFVMDSVSYATYLIVGEKRIFTLRFEGGLCDNRQINISYKYEDLGFLIEKNFTSSMTPEFTIYKRVDEKES